MRHLLLPLLILISSTAYAGPINGVFGEGVFDLKWGSSLAEMKKVFPDGESKEMSGADFYVIEDGRALFGIERASENKISFGFDDSGRLRSMIIEFPASIDPSSNSFGRLLSVLDTEFGPHDQDTKSIGSNLYITWPEDTDLTMGVLYQVSVESSFLSSSTTAKLSFTLSKAMKGTATDAKSLGF